MHTCIFCYSVPSICRWTAEQQSFIHITGFLRVIYSILNASVILERNEKRLERNEKRLERNETCLARNETRGGNLPLSGNSCYPHLPCFAPATQLETHLITYIATLIQHAQCPLRQGLLHHLTRHADLSSVIILCQLIKATHTLIVLQLWT